MLHPPTEFCEYESPDRDNGRSAHFGEDDNDDEGDIALTPALLPILTTLKPQVAPLKYFLLFDVNGTLIHFVNPKILGGNKGMKKGESRARPGLEDCLGWIVDVGMEICFWSCVMEHNLAPRIDFIRGKVPRLPKNCLQFGQSTCRVSAYRNKDSPAKPYFLKSLEYLFEQHLELVKRGGTVENTLLINDSPYKNALNNLFNAIHPPTYTMYSDAKLKKGEKPFLMRVLQPLLYKLYCSGQSVPEFMQAHQTFGERRVFPDDAWYPHLTELA
jgi:hypothetical protein